MRVLFMTNCPSPYRVDFFNELGKHCDLTVSLEKIVSESRNDSWFNYDFQNFNAVVLGGLSFKKIHNFCPRIISLLRKSYDIIICTGTESPTTYLAAFYLRATRTPYFMERDGGFFKVDSRLKRIFKRFLICGAQGHFTTCEENIRYLESLGVDKKRIFKYPFTSLYGNDILKGPVPNIVRRGLRQKLGMYEKCIVLSVGRFTYLGGYGKGYDTMLRTAARLPSDIGFYIVGDGPTEEFLTMRDNIGASNVHFVGFKNKEELKEYYQAADLFVLMTIGDVWGLVINEAMANALPIITTDRCIAGVELIRDGENGYIIPVGDDKALEQRINLIINAKETAERMSVQSLKAILPYTFENMVKEHMRVFRQILTNRKITR